MRSTSVVVPVIPWDVSNKKAFSPFSGVPVLLIFLFSKTYIQTYIHFLHKKSTLKSAFEFKNGNPVGIRTQTNWTKTSCATITQRGYS